MAEQELTNSSVVVGTVGADREGQPCDCRSGQSDGLTVAAVQVSDTENIGSTALGGAAQARAKVSLARLHDVGGNSHGGAGKSEDGEELHVGWYW